MQARTVVQKNSCTDPLAITSCAVELKLQIRPVVARQITVNRFILIQKGSLLEIIENNIEITIVIQIGISSALGPGNLRESPIQRLI